MSLERHGCAALLVVAFILFAANLDKPEMTSIDECRSGVIVRDMVEAGNWLLPRTPDGYLTEKPILYYGSSALLSLAVGLNEWSLRGISVLAAIGTLWLVWHLAGLYGSRTAAALAVIALASNFYFIVWARKAMVDMTMAFFLTAGLTAYFAARAGKLRPRIAGVLCGAAFGLAVMTKGPLGLAIAGVVITADQLVAVRGRLRDLRIAWGPLFAAVGIVIAISLLWYVPGYLRNGKEFLQTSLLAENFYMPLGLEGGISGSHAKPIQYYPSIQLMVLFPLAAFIPQTVAWCFRKDAGPGRREMLVWFLAGFVFFMIPTNKRQYYLLPLQPAVAVLVGLAIDRALAAGSAPLLRRMSLLFGAMLVVAGLGAGIIVLNPKLAAFAGAKAGQVLSLSPVMIFVFWALTVGAGVALVMATRTSTARTVQAAIACAALIIAFRTILYDSAAAKLDKTKPVAARLARELPPGAKVAAHAPLYGYGVYFYWPTPLPNDAESKRAADWIIVQRSRMAEVPGPMEMVGEFIYTSADHGMVLLKKVHDRR